MLVFLILGCATPPEDTGAPPPADSGLEFASWSELAPQWTKEEVGEELEAALSYGLPRGEVFRDHILALLAQGDADCPGHEDQISSVEYGLEGCVADSGYTYRGILVYEEEFDEDESTQVLLQKVSMADFEIIHPSGEIFYGGGSMDYERLQPLDANGHRESRALIRGMWADPLHEESWFSTGVSTYLSMLMEEDNGETMLQLEGTLGIGGHHLYFNNIEFLSSDCDTQPRSGSIWIRQPDSSWFQLEFPADCGCPDLMWNDTEAFGTLCVDTSIIHASLLQSMGADI